VWLYSVDDRWDAARVLLDRLPNIILCMLVKLFSIKTCHESMTRSCGKASDAALPPIARSVGVSWAWMGCGDGVV
jgi:hypothetical protein